MNVTATRRAQQADAIVEATLEALRKYGYAATSLQRIAEEAGTSKRMVLHYFATREELFDTVVLRLGRRILAQVEEAAEGQTDPAVALGDGLDRLWDEIVADPGIHAVFFGLLAESVTNGALRTAIATVREESRTLLARMIEASRPAGETPDPAWLASSATLILGTIVGLTIDYLERGDTPALRLAYASFKERVEALALAGPDAP